MTNEKIMDAIGMMEEDFLAEALGETKSTNRVKWRLLRNALVAAVVVALLGCMVFAAQMPEVQMPVWEPYGEAEEMLDVMFGTRRQTPREGMVEVRHQLVGKLDDGTAQYEEVWIPVLSGASREPVSGELAALVEPYLIPVGKSVVDPTGTITLEVMAYYYEPESQCGAIYLQLTDPTGEFCGYVPADPGIVQTPGEEIEVPQGIGMVYLQIFERQWGKPWAHGEPSNLCFVKSLSNETTWTYVAYFFCDNYDTVDLDIGFESEPTVDHRPYRIDIDLEKTPAMDSVVLGNAGNKELITVSPVGMHINDAVVPYGAWIDEVVIHFDDGSSYVVVDDAYRSSALSRKEAFTYGYAARVNNHFAFANIIDVSKIYYVEVNGRHYFEIDW